jgi:hypothetical protein
VNSIRHTHNLTIGRYAAGLLIPLSAGQVAAPAGANGPGGSLPAQDVASATEESAAPFVPRVVIPLRPPPGGTGGGTVALTKMDDQTALVLEAAGLEPGRAYQARVQAGAPEQPSASVGILGQLVPDAQGRAQLTATSARLGAGAEVALALEWLGDGDHLVAVVAPGQGVAAQAAIPALVPGAGPGGPPGSPDAGGAAAAWQLYANSTYGFTLEIPATGILADPQGTRPIGWCGTAIREGAAAAAGLNGVLVDNLVFVEVVDWPGTARSYLDATEPNAQEIDRLYTFRPVVSNADEALVPVARPSTSGGSNVDGPFTRPLGYVLAVHRKGTRLLVVRPLQNPGQPNACVAASPAVLERIAASLLFTVQ